MGACLRRSPPEEVDPLVCFRCLRLEPNDAAVVWAEADEGELLSTDATAHWSRSSATGE
jgi:hypothetical protein